MQNRYMGKRAVKTDPVEPSHDSPRISTRPAAALPSFQFSLRTLLLLFVCAVRACGRPRCGAAADLSAGSSRCKHDSMQKPVQRPRWSWLGADRRLGRRAAVQDKMTVSRLRAPWLLIVPWPPNRPHGNLQEIVSKPLQKRKTLVYWRHTRLRKS